MAINKLKRIVQGFQTRTSQQIILETTDTLSY
jgi:hypothetical protein